MTTEEVSPFTPEESTEETNSGKGPEANAWVRQGPGRCAMEGYEHPGKNLYLALESNFMHWHQPQQRASVPVQRVSISHTVKFSPQSLNQVNGDNNCPLRSLQTKIRTKLRLEKNPNNPLDGLDL